ncbi:MAG: glutathione S-transferase family protein [Pseudomonadota bacterium]
MKTINLPSLNIVAHTLCPYVQRSVIVLKEKGIPYTRTDIDLTNPPEWFNKISPLGKVPVLIVDKISSLFESAVICEYINEITPGSLHSNKALDKAYHRAWIEFGSGILDDIGNLYNTVNKDDFEEIKIKIKNKFELLEKELSGTVYFSSNRFQVVDAVYAPIFRYFDVFEKTIKLNIFESTPKINNWRLKLQQRNSVKQAVTKNYADLLLVFIKNRNSYLSQYISIT